MQSKVLFRWKSLSSMTFHVWKPMQNKWTHSLPLFHCCRISDTLQSNGQTVDGSLLVLGVFYDVLHFILCKHSSLAVACHWTDENVKHIKCDKISLVTQHACYCSIRPIPIETFHTLYEWESHWRFCALSAFGQSNLSRPRRRLRQHADQTRKPTRK